MADLPLRCRWFGHTPDRIDDTKEITAFSAIMVEMPERHVIQRTLLGFFCPRCGSWFTRPNGEHIPPDVG